MGVFDDIGRKLDPRKRGNPVSQAGHEVEKLARQAANEAVKPVKHVADEALAKAKHLEGNLEHEVEQAVKAALDLALREIQKGVLHSAVRILDAAAPDTADIQIGPIGLNDIDVRDRFDALRFAVDNPPRDKHGIKDLVQRLLPGSVSITLSAELALLIVSSDSLSVGMTLKWVRDNFIARADAALGALT